MNICFHSTNSDSYCYIAATDRLCRCYFCKLNILPVSYTHLTLPTICSV